MDGAVPLHDAVQYGFDNYVVHLLKHGADPTIQNDMDKSPLDVAPPAIQALILSTCKESNDQNNDHPEAMEVENVIVESNEPTEKVIEEDKEVSPVVQKPNEQTENLNKEDTVVPQINDNLDSMEVENAIVESKEHAENAIEEEELVPTVVVNDHDELNDSSNSVLATPLDISTDEIITVPSSIEEEISNVIEHPRQETVDVTRLKDVPAQEYLTDTLQPVSS